MPKSTIRLACMECDRSDFDFISPAQLRETVRAGWKDVERVQTFRQACKTSDPSKPTLTGHSAFEWWTHIGWCPDCAAGADK